MASTATVQASSERGPQYAAHLAIDGKISTPSRWVSAETAGPHWLELSFDEPHSLVGAHVYSGWGEKSAIRTFELQMFENGDWVRMPGASRLNSDKTLAALSFGGPIRTDRIRLYSSDRGGVRLKEIVLWAGEHALLPPLGTAVSGPEAPTPQPWKHHQVMVNQSGYNREWPKRFTAPLTNSAEFAIKAAQSGKTLYQGQVRDGLGDFSDFRPEPNGGEYVVVVSGGDLKPGRSDPFRIEPMWMQRVSLAPAVHFMIDVRSMVGTHPSAYGGTPWRDGGYYTFEVPSLVILYLSNPAFFEALPVEIDHAADKARILDPEFEIVRERGDTRAFETTREYYQSIDPPVGDHVPDIIQLIHWGIGCYSLDLVSRDPSGDPAGKKLHAATLEQLAFFLYGLPAYEQYFTSDFISRVRNLAFTHWEEVGGFELDTHVGTYKGRHCPGESIMPNLMMHAVAQRLGRPDASRHLEAAVTQAAWVVSELDPADPRIMKGQRMSEHKLITGLAMLRETHPQRTPQALDAWLARWADVAIERGDNLWDYRKYDERHWTLPRWTDRRTGGSRGWNEPGNTAGFPAIALLVAEAVDAERATRLHKLAAAAFDNLFGRNPIGTHSANRGPRDYVGVERGWPIKYKPDTCARLELVRGTLSSCASNEHFPFNPDGDFRHPEGWTAFNAAFNVSLAYSCRAASEFLLLDPDSGQRLKSAPAGAKVKLVLRTPIFINDKPLSAVPITIDQDDTSKKLLLRPDATLSPGHFSAIWTVPNDAELTARYGFGAFATTMTIR